MANVAFLGLGVMGYPMAGIFKAQGILLLSITAPLPRQKPGCRAWWRNGHYTSRGGTGR